MNNTQGKSQFDLFDNPMVTAAKKSMSPRSQERYRKLGESMYGGINFTDSKVDNRPAPMVEALAYVEESLKSGLHPSMLEDNEKAILVDAYGEEWYKNWGYIEEDLDSIVTVKK